MLSQPYITEIIIANTRNIIGKAIKKSIICMKRIFFRLR